jgi:hypothetical protein
MHSYHHSISLRLVIFDLLFFWIKTTPHYVYFGKGKFCKFLAIGLNQSGFCMQKLQLKIRKEKEEEKKGRKAAG